MFLVLKHFIVYGMLSKSWRKTMDRPITTLFMLMSVDGKITPGITNVPLWQNSTISDGAM